MSNVIYVLTLKECFDKPQPDVVLYYKSKVNAIERGRKHIDGRKAGCSYHLDPLKTQD